MTDGKRFKVIYKQGTLNCTKVIVDTKTGVTYLFHAEGDAGGVSPLLDREGKPVITPAAELYD